MIYLDNAATTRPNERALARAAALASEKFFNPSALYGGGIAVHEELNEARKTVLSFLSDGGFELLFTSGGTEADNHAVFCAGRRGNVVISAGEHAAVYAPCREQKSRVELRLAPLDRGGAVDRERLVDLVDEKTSLVSVVHVNNETGAVNDIAALARAVKQKNPRCLFHSDGVQAFGKLAFRLPAEVDLYSLSAHKIGGLKGTGALVKRKGLALAPFVFGGGQESGYRSGTENMLGILDFRFAAEEKFARLNEDGARLAGYREALWEGLDHALFVRITPENASPYILTVSAPGMRGEVLQRMAEGEGVVVGTGSACSSKNPYSRVIEACGYEKEVLGGVLRISFSPETTEEEIERAAEVLNGAAREWKKKLK